MRAKSTLITTLGLLWLTGCGGGVEGDWFLCEDANCLKLANQGLRFDGDRWRVLASEGQPENGYCEVTEMTGVYELKEERLTIRTAKESLNYLLRLDDDVLVLTDAEGQTTFWLAVAEQKTLPCKDDSAPSLPSSETSQDPETPQATPPGIVTDNPCQAASSEILACTGGEPNPSSETVDCSGDVRAFAECVLANAEAFCAYVRDPGNNQTPCPI